MGNVICALNSVGNVDIAFFIICAVIVALIVAVYFLIPVFNKKLYRDQRENLHKREAAFKTNLKNNRTDGSVTEEKSEAESSDVSADE